MAQAPARPPRSLMARLAGVDPPKDLGEAIVRNLTDVLNNRKSYGAFQRTLGLGDFFGRIGTKGVTDVLQQELIDNIRALEPRLTCPKVRRLGQDPDFWLHYEVEGVAGGEPLRLIISFLTTVGGVRVRVLP